MSSIHHICIQTDNYKHSLDFYTQILGYEIVKETNNFHTRDYNTWLHMDGFMIELQTSKAGETLAEYNKTSKGIVHFCLLVDNVEKEYLRIKKLGFANFKSKNGNDVYTVENENLVKLIAPEGTIIEMRDTRYI